MFRWTLLSLVPSIQTFTAFLIILRSQSRRSSTQTLIYLFFTVYQLFLDYLKSKHLSYRKYNSSYTSEYCIINFPNTSLRLRLIHDIPNLRTNECNEHELNSDFSLGATTYYDTGFYTDILFLPKTATLWNKLPRWCFLKYYNLNHFLVSAQSLSNHFTHMALTSLYLLLLISLNKTLPLPRVAFEPCIELTLFFKKWLALI